MNGYPEPILGASAYQYAHRNDGKIREGDVVLVLDFGGYTLDIAVMKAVKGKNGVQLVKMRSCDHLL